ncbi:MAG TPA: YbjN domain-containing protein [bacterium]|nr:YbjN domain-containing protein [bacterium]
MTEVTLDQVANYCTELGLMNRIDPERQFAEAMFTTKQGSHLVYFRIDTEREVLSMRLPMLVSTPVERRAMMARVIAHLNYNLLLKGFVFDLSDGEVAYDLPVPFRGIGVCGDQISQCLLAAAWTLNSHLPTVREACWGSRSVEELLGLPLPEPADSLARALSETSLVRPPLDGGPDRPAQT